MNRFLILIVAFAISCKNSLPQIEETEPNPEAIKLNNQGLQLIQKGKLDSALLVFDKAIELDKAYYLPHSNKYSIYSSLKQYDNALKEAEIVTQLKSDMPEGWLVAGATNELVGKSKKAKNCFQVCKKLYLEQLGATDDQTEREFIHLNLMIVKILLEDSSYTIEEERLKESGNLEDYVELYSSMTKDQLIETLFK